MLLGALLLTASLSGTWTTHGPHSGDMSAIAATTSGPRVLYAGSSSGVLRSDDGGATWRNVGAAIKPVAFLGVDPLDPNLVIAATTLSETEGELWRTTNGGAAWTRADLPAPLRPSGIVVDSNRVMYVGSNCQPYWAKGVVTDAHEAAGIYRSTDGGATWSNIKGGGLCVEHFALDPADPAHLFTYSFGGGIEESRDGGATWTSNPEIPTRAVVAHPTESNVRFGISTTPRSRFLVSHDAGNSWSDVEPKGVTGSAFLSLTIDRGTGRLFLGTDDGLFRSGDGGTVWLRVGAPALVSGIEVDPSTREVVASTSSGLTSATFPYAEAHTLDTRDAATYALQVIVQETDPARLFALSYDTHGRYLERNRSRIFRSRDGGDSWQAIGETTAPAPSRITVDGAGDLYAATINGTRVLRLRRDAVAGEELPRTFEAIHAIAADPKKEGVLYVLTWNQMLRSADGGLTWSAQNVGTSYFLTFDPQNSDHLWSIENYGGGIARFTNGVPDAGFRHDYLREPLAIAASNPNVMYAAIANHTPTTGSWNRLARSDDGGKEWTWLATPMPITTITAIAVDPHDANTVWVATGSQGIFVSHDGGVTLTPANDGLPTRVVLSLAFDPSGRALHAGTEQGVWTMRERAPLTRRRAVR
ncbi:MAG TPA: hypothetical protein VHW00_17085 [Thermoanaerobaculia bacterium]|nr:hypothetical protein [Thermoanaerobaculia bacterium]